MTKWHCQIGGQQYGPVSEEDLRQWIAEGRLVATDSVWREGLAEWATVSSIPELWGQGPAPLTPAVPQPSQGTYRPLENAPGAVASLVCGIIGVALCCGGLILGIIALMQQKKAKALIAQYPQRYGGAGLCTAGLVLGIIGIVWGSFWVLYYGGIFLIMIIAAAAS